MAGGQGHMFDPQFDLMSTEKCMSGSPTHPSRLPVVVACVMIPVAAAA